MSKAKAKLADGFTCNCGRYEKYSVYVYAHYREDLRFTCPACQAVWSIISGSAYLVQKAPKNN